MESIEKILWVAISLVILLIGMTLLFAIFFSMFNPYDNIAFANTEKLRSAINEACFTGEVKLNNLELKQNIMPAWTTFLGEVFPKWMINNNGDPNYIIYYEAFPPGEATGWEVYQNFQYRLLTPLPLDYDRKTHLDVNNYAEQQISRFYQRRDGSDLSAGQKDASVSALVVSNIVLNGYYNPQFLIDKKSSEIQKPVSTDPTQSTNLKQSFYNFGDWKNKGNDGSVKLGDNVFLFNNYAGLTTLQKSLVKYIPCGENSLCLKTRKGVYRYPLIDDCKDIKNIQIVYDARERGEAYIAGAGITVAIIYGGGTLLSIGKILISAVPTTTLKLVGGFAGFVGLGYSAKVVGQYFGTAFLGFKTADFSLSSPCDISGDGAITVKRMACTEKMDFAETDVPQCTQVVSYPLYSYNSEMGLTNTGDHYVCVDKVWKGGRITKDKIIDSPDSNDYNIIVIDECIRITIEKEAKGCWTPDPSKKDITFSDTQLYVFWLGLTPIHDAMDYVAPGNNLEDIFVLRPSSEKELNDFLANWERKLSWGWPWSFDW